MTDQPRHETAASSTLWRGGPRDLPPPPGTVSQSGPSRELAAAAPPRLTLALIERGRERYAIYCTPCHGPDGAGGGPVVERGFPRPPDLVAPGQRARSARDLFRTIGGGRGIMYGVGDRVPPEDRWAIVAYVRALQAARSARVEPSSRKLRSNYPGPPQGSTHSLEVPALQPALRAFGRDDG
jgi:mono/diheme cytochrome c family protein